MRVISEATLNLFRGPGKCSWCGRWLPRREAAHVIAKGIGGADQLDIPLNLVALGGAFDCGCHRENHEGRHPLRIDLFAVVAARESMLQPDVIDRLHKMLRAPREAVVCGCCEGAGVVKYVRFPGKIRRLCVACEGVGIMLDGQPWRERPRRPSWERQP